MRWVAPAFWYRPLHGIHRALLPLESLYIKGQRLAKKRALLKQRSVTIPVISVGNLVLGGAGKTPVCLFLARWLKHKGYTPHCITRGYGRRSKEMCFRVDLHTHTPQDVGDEAWLLAQEAPTWVSPCRIKAACQAEQAGATHLILDDAHQHHSLRKDLSIVVVNASQGFGNGHVMPAGPLREPKSEGMERAQLIWCIDDCTSLTWSFPHHSTIKSAYQLPPHDRQIVQGKSCVAFTGIGFPEKFFHFLRQNGAHLTHTAVFPDHHFYTAAEQNRLIQKAQNVGALLVTTEKDAVKWPASPRKHLTIILPRLMVQDMGPLEHALCLR